MNNLHFTRNADSLLSNISLAELANSKVFEKKIS